MRVKDITARNWYANEVISQGWTVAALDRQVSTLFYERLLSSQDQAAVRKFCYEYSQFQKFQPLLGEICWAKNLQNYAIIPAYS